MARRENLTCHCGAFPMIDDEHVIEHGRDKAKHTATACDEDKLLVKRPAAPAQRVFRIGVTK